MPQCERVPHRLDVGGNATVVVEMRAAYVLVAAATVASCSYDEDTLAPEPGQAQPRWISIDADALDTARTVATIDAVEVNGDIALVRLDEQDLANLSRVMHEQHHRCGGFIVHGSHADARLALAVADREPIVHFAAPYTIDNAVAVNRLLHGEVSARYSPASALLMGLFVLDLYRRVKGWPTAANELRDLTTFLAVPNSWMIVLDLLGVAISGGMFVVPLYAFLTTTVPKSETARTIAANNIVNSGLMVAATLVLTVAVQLGITVADSLLIVASATIMSAWLGWKPHVACD